MITPYKPPISLLSPGPMYTAVVDGQIQIVDEVGTPQRINCVSWAGGGVRNAMLDGVTVDAPIPTQLAQVVRMGFNCIRLHTNAAGILAGDPILAVYDQVISYAALLGLRVIVSCQNDEGLGPSYLSPPNGLWYDSGGSSDGTDGQANAGTITDALFTQAWQLLAMRWQGWLAILGYDIINEPYAIGSGVIGLGSTWGGYTSVSGYTGIVNSDRDICAMYQRVGNAIQAIDPNPLIICQALIDYPSGAFSGDLRAAQQHPVVLNLPNKVVLSVHEYPDTIAAYGIGIDTGSIYISRMQNMWGFMFSNPAPTNACPVWVGDCAHCSCMIPSEQNWASTLVSFVNGAARGGPNFSGANQPIGTSWRNWLVSTGFTNSRGQADTYGCLTAWGASGDLMPAQAAYINQLAPL